MSSFRVKRFIPLGIKLILGFWPILTLISIVFMIVGIWIINHRILTETQEKVRHDLNAAREIYSNQLSHIYTVVKLTSESFFLREYLLANQIEQATGELIRIKNQEGLDSLNVTDENGVVLLRTSNLNVNGDSQAHDLLINLVLQQKEPLKSTVIVPKGDLEKDSPLLAVRAHFEFIDTPGARLRNETEETSGMMLKAAAPIMDEEGRLIGILYGGVLLNRNFEIVDKVKQTVFQGMEYKGKEIGTATIFQDDVRISTNVLKSDDSRAIGTRVSEVVYNQVMQGVPWIGRAYVVNNWYISAYEPIRDIQNKIIGILYVGMFEEKYREIILQTTHLFLSIAIAGALVTLVVSYFISRRILIPINKLIDASKELSRGNLDLNVETVTQDELQVLVDSFNSMAASLKKRDDLLKEFATKKIMESERLALVGQLSANVAHELNNPLQGIVAYSHLLIERTTEGDPNRSSLEKIVGQANRARDIIRGLLDFSRQREPDKILCNVNAILHESVSLVRNQALFQNIQIVENLKPDLPSIILDPSQIERVFINMILNAAEAMDGSGKLTLITACKEKDNLIEISIEDTGHGISEENLARIFDPFFTTKEIGHGTGLGLAISYGIVTAHKGSIGVESVVGQGTTFNIKLPLNGMKKQGSNGNEG